MRAIILIMRVMLHWSSHNYSSDDVTRVVLSAIERETPTLSAELLVGISQHESDLKPMTVSWVDHGTRRDGQVCVDGHSTVGYLQAMAKSLDQCLMIQAQDGMSAGVTELTSWAILCRRLGHPGSASCVLRGHAGGTACALDSNQCSVAQRAFVDYFLRTEQALKTQAHQRQHQRQPGGA
jgi:hypothetical protein